MNDSTYKTIFGTYVLNINDCRLAKVIKILVQICEELNYCNLFIDDILIRQSINVHNLTPMRARMRARIRTFRFV